MDGAGWVDGCEKITSELRRLGDVGDREGGASPRPYWGGDVC